MTSDRKQPEPSIDNVPVTFGALSRALRILPAVVSITIALIGASVSYGMSRADTNSVNVQLAALRQEVEANKKEYQTEVASIKEQRSTDKLAQEKEFAGFGKKLDTLINRLNVYLCAQNPKKCRDSFTGNEPTGIEADSGN